MKDLPPNLPEDLPMQVAVLRTALVNLVNDSFEKNGKIDKLTKRIENLEIAQRQTDERSNAVILMAEKFFSGENGDSKK